MTKDVAAALRREDAKAQLTAHEKEVLGLTSKRRALIEDFEMQASAGRETTAVKRPPPMPGIGDDHVVQENRRRVFEHEQARLNDLFAKSELSSTRQYLIEIPELDPPLFFLDGVASNREHGPRSPGPS